MAKKWQKIATVTTAAVLACSMTIGMTACGPERYEIEKLPRTGWEDPKEYTYNTYTGQLPSIWTDVMTSDAADRDGYAYLQSSFYEFDYAYDSDGNVVPGGFTVNYSAATKLEDVTDEYAGKYGVQEDATSGQAFRITLRNDLKWDDGTPIDAEDFVFTMEQQLNPKYLFAQASNYYSGNYVIHNARNFVYQGQQGWYTVRDVYTTLAEADNGKMYFTLGSPSENKDKYPSDTTKYAAADTPGAVSSFRTGVGFPDTWTAENVANYIINTGVNNNKVDASVQEVLALEGKTYAEILADETLKATWEKVLGCWKTEDNEELDFFVMHHVYEDMDFDQVGFRANSQYELDIIIDNTIHPVDANGNLTYEAAYYLQSFPLVKQDIWERCEVAPSAAGGLYTNTYGTGSVDKIPSWGPYKLTNFQNQVSYTLSRNTNWYGYSMDQYKTQFQTDTIFTRYIPEWNTAWNAFLLGELDGVTLDTTVMGDYRNTNRAYFTPDTATFCVNLQSSNLATDSRKGNDILAYTEFRNALSLAIDRDDFCAVNSPSSQPALGYLNDMYYYDVENGGVYRDTDQAREALLEAYGATKNEAGKWVVGGVAYETAEEAELSLTGYNVGLARDLMQQAYNKAVADGVYKKGDKITLTYGITEQTASEERLRTWMQDAFNEAAKGTDLEGQIEITYFTMDAQNWSQQFMDGAFDICFSAWGNAPFNPYYLFGGTQIWDANRTAQGWNPGDVKLTLDVQGGDGQTSYTDLELDLYQWDAALQGMATTGGGSAAQYNFSSYPINTKLDILAAEEVAVLGTYWGIPVYSRYTASLMGYKVEYMNYDYNTFMAYGGVQYMSYNFDDAGWEAFCEEHGELNYKY